MLPLILAQSNQENRLPAKTQAEYLNIAQLKSQKDRFRAAQRKQ